MKVKHLLGCDFHVTLASRHLHSGWVYEWPATAQLQNSTGLVDSFREAHPDPLKEPGNTWSTLNQHYGHNEWNNRIPEPQDRIDFIFYKSAQLRTVASDRYAGQFVPYPADIKQNDWPSDHYAVVSDFEWINSSKIVHKQKRRLKTT